MGWHPEQDCPTQVCGEPPLYTAGAFSPQRFAVSYVKRELVTGSGAEDAEVGENGGQEVSGGEKEEEPEETAAPVPAPSLKKSKPKKAKPPILTAPPEWVEEFEYGKTCKYLLPDQVSSRPGAPCIPPARYWPYVSNTAWRTALGERIIKAVFPEVTSKQCEGWTMFGDQTWCNKAMKRKDVLALSFGIEERDLFSEYMSNIYHYPVLLYDCFIEPEKSPPMAGTAPNATGKCDKNGGHCYETWYKPFAVCLGPEKTEIQGRKYDTLAGHLRGRGRLSTHVKIDVEGSEWTVLEQFIASEADMARVRTLDMEIHFGFRAASEGKYDDLPEEQRITRQIKIIEGLRKRFYCTGTTLETYRQGWWPEKDCTVQQCHEPVLHTAGGFSPQMFAISFVNKIIVDGDSSTEAGEETREETEEEAEQ